MGKNNCKMCRYHLVGVTPDEKVCDKEESENYGVETTDSYSCSDFEEDDWK